MTLLTKIKEVNKIASELAPKFKKLGLETISDLLFYYPFRYDDYSNLLKISEVTPGTMLTIKGKIEMLESRRSWKRRMMITEGLISDESGTVKVVWFNQRYIAKILNPGDAVFLSGKALATESGLEFHNPTFEKVNKYDNFTAHTARLVPVYSATENLSQRQIRFVMKRILPFCPQIKDWLPEEIKKSANLKNLAFAVRQIHFPENEKILDGARFRLKFDEIFLLQARVRLMKQELLLERAQKIEFHKEATQEFVNNLPFILTAAQKKSAWEIIKDLGKTRPMNRLLEGDVGSGKTIAAGVALLNALLNKFQVAYMAPTEILAEQQFNSFCKIFEKYDFSIALMTGSAARVWKPETRNQKSDNNHPASPLAGGSAPLLEKEGSLTRKKNNLLKTIKNGEIDLVIGTHALIQDKVQFHNLNLVIVDEQHRFGIGQRKELKEKATDNLKLKGFYPHFLSMSATPIPRSLALTLYGDLDLSVIDEMPKNRLPIITKAILPQERGSAYEFIRSEIGKGRQAFVICPLIDPSDKLGFKAVKDEFEKLDKEIFKDVQVGLLHGRLKSAEKEKIMREFADNKIKILVSTSVIEVGIDVPNATVMWIESAERFGLAQLHQLRGRVGRAEHQSYCFLFTESDSETTVKRMQAMISCQNGFELAEKDLEFRGPGEVYGIKQSGFFDSLKIAKLTDWPVIKAVKAEIEKLFAFDPKLEKHPTIRNEIKEFETNVHWE
ncbi:MAG: ATP-dependent DNA helicase RecG [Patescibacteria group bacterium]|nr:ATP-dependent DNA helicase RecG [Patescibacteria group bacterium]